MNAGAEASDGPPVRIRLSRAKGWRKPPGAVVVARPSKWATPFRYCGQSGLVRYPAALSAAPWELEGRSSADGAYHPYHHPDGRVTPCRVRYGTRAELVELFRRALLREPDESIRMTWGADDRAVSVTVDDVRRELAGRDLACWCPLDQPCHADVLLKISNTGKCPAEPVAVTW